MCSFHRMLLHRLAVRFRLEHQVLEALPTVAFGGMGMTTSASQGGTYVKETAKTRCVGDMFLGTTLWFTSIDRAMCYCIW